MTKDDIFKVLQEELIILLNKQEVKNKNEILLWAYKIFDDGISIGRNEGIQQYKQKLIEYIELSV